MVPDWVIASGSRRRDFKARSGSIAGVKAAQGRKNDEHQDAKKRSVDKKPNQAPERLY